jgi:hypothetical protein
MEQNNPFISSAVIVGFVVAVVVTIVSLVLGYYMIGSEPGTSTMIMMSLMGLVSCMVGIFAGLFAVRHHVKIFNAPLKMGRGAIIGLTSGVFVAIFTSILSLIWMLVDPSYVDRLMDAMIRSMETLGPQGEAQIDGIAQQFQDLKTVAGQLKSLGINALISGALNAITGILGVKFFAPKGDQDAL